MSRKNLFEILIGLVLLVAFVLVVQLGVGSQGVVSTNVEAINTGRLAGSDWIERHPTSVKLNYLVGSDWIERHPAEIYAGSDWIERNPAKVYTGSDYYERHTTVLVAKPANYAGSDWIERHPDTAYGGSDYFERHPAQPTR